MKTVTFWQGVVVALFFSIIGSIGFFALSALFSEDFAVRLLISGLAIAYSLYLLSRSPVRVGRITVLSALLLLLILLWLFYTSLSLFLIFHVLAIWLIRSLYRYAGIFSSLADLGLSALSIASAFWALHHTGSVFLTFWCFFLVQALFVYIPAGLKSKTSENTVIPDSQSNFKHAYQAAETAVRKLSSYNQE